MKAIVTCVILLCSLFATACAGAAAAPSAQGNWLGALKVPGGELRILFHITPRAEGGYTATADSPDQGVDGIPVGEVTVTDGTLRILVPAFGGRFEGKLNADRTKAEGTWEQSGQSSPLTLVLTKDLPKAKRPQEPKKPYPYHEEEVTYENKAAGVKFAGTFTRPEGTGPFPAVLLLTGSGPQDRDETVFGHKPFLILADALTRRGLAVLRVDDRGVGGSTGDRKHATTKDYADDALAGVAFLMTRPDVDPKRLGLLGHSEGALLAALAATQSSDVAFIVLIGGPGVPGEEVILVQGRLIALADGASEEAVAKQEADSKRYFAIVKEEKDDAVAATRLRAVMQESFDAYSEEQRARLGLTEEGLKANMNAVTGQLLSPWFRFFLTYDPAPTLAKVKVPVLADGGKDLQVPPNQSFPAVAKALKDGGNTRATLRVLPGLNHPLQTAKTGSPTEYAQIEETMSLTALQVVGDWLVAQTKER